MATTPEWQLVMDGLNEADSGNPFLITCHRVKFSPTKGLDIIADDFAALQLEFKLLKNTTIVGTGLSQYMSMELVA
jgi:hypothetical protein